MATKTSYTWNLICLTLSISSRKASKEENDKNSEDEKAVKKRDQEKMALFLKRIIDTGYSK